ncbi:MAG: SagB/ThcOx family dehydrogenase [Planctomycetota bacterium]
MRAKGHLRSPIVQRDAYTIMDAIGVAKHYHETTKHHYDRYARSLGYLDWATQPDPFRRFRGAQCVPLFLTEASGLPSYDALYESGSIASQPVCLESISEFLQYSLALSAWKEYRDSRWALRINPSSGNLHPTEGYLAICAVRGLADIPGVFHYAPMEHALERRCEIHVDVWDELINALPRGTFLAGLSSIHWREAWKYGERAFRYCQHDVGHTLAALCLSAALQGWQVRTLIGVSDAEIGMLLGLNRDEDFEQAERECPDVLIAIIPSTDSRTTDATSRLSTKAIESIRQGKWYGKANLLSSDHVEWDLIDTVTDACVKSSTSGFPRLQTTMEFSDPFPSERPSTPARRIIQQRRSAVAMDGHTSITADQFYLMMDRVLPRFECPPWSALGPPAYVHLGIFVHRVTGLVPGLYFLVRAPSELVMPRESMSPTFDWEKPIGCPQSLPLYHLLSGDACEIAGQVSCGQSIAADGAFSLGMIAEFENPLRIHGPWIYRKLFWETGMIGQVLYLEAEAIGIRSTGIGCFFDDSVHDIFGFKGRKYQSLYHFTVGGPVEDTRLTTLPPYPPEVTARATGSAST